MNVIVACRDAAVDELPAAAARLLRTAEAAGWAGRATYAKVRVLDVKARAFAHGDRVVRDGTTASVVDVHKDRAHLSVLVDGEAQLTTWDVAETVTVEVAEAQGRVVESVAVRLWRLPLVAVGEWWSGKFHHAYTSTVGGRGQRIGARDLARLVKAA